MRLSIAGILGSIALLSGITAVPAVSGAQAVASICKDGTSSAAKGRGACAQHGGVDAAATKSAKAAARAANRTSAASSSSSRDANESRSTRASTRVRATVNCADGTTGSAGRGACSHHGGVAGAPAGGSTAETSGGSPGAAVRAPMPRASSGSVARSSAGSSRTNPSAGSKEDNDPAGALAQCNDGLYSHANNRRGACSRHGGVKQWMHS